MRAPLVGDPRNRARDVASLDAMIAARPLRPPPFTFGERVRKPGEAEARRWLAHSLDGAGPVFVAPQLSEPPPARLAIPVAPRFDFDARV